VALGRAAAQEVTAARMSASDAGEVFRDAALRLCLRRTDDV
jgi:hypothetical protein